MYQRSTLDALLDVDTHIPTARPASLTALGTRAGAGVLLLGDGSERQRARAIVVRRRRAQRRAASLRSRVR